MFAVFRKRDFSLMWTAQLVSTIGSSLTDLAAGILVFRVTNSVLNVGLMLMVTALPGLVVGLVAGVFVDRFHRKYILIASDLLRAGLVAAIPFAVSHWGILALYVIVLLASTVKQFFEPAWESVLPDIATEQELTSANSFLSISSFGSTAIGFAAAGILSTIDIDLPFWIDAATFLFSAACVALVAIAATETSETTTVRVVAANLVDGLRFLVGTRILRSAFIVAIPTFFAFGLWNVLLLPMATRVLGATEREYGYQEALTSVGFVVASLTLARYLDRIREGQWLVISLFGMGVFGVAYGLVSNIWLAIAIVTVTGFLNSPGSIARRLILQRNTPRDKRGRVFSAFFVSRDVVFLLGMATAGLGDLISIRLLIVASSLVLIGAAAVTQFMPGLGQPAAEWRRSMRLLRAAPTARGLGVGHAATSADLETLLGLLPTLGALDDRGRGEFISRATVAEAPSGTVIVREGDQSNAAYFILDGHVVAGVPAPDGEYRSLSAMGPGDFFGEIAALTGSPRTANVVADEDTTVLEVPADTLRKIMAVPEVSQLVLSKLTERLTRTTNADLPRLAGYDQRDLRELRTEQKPVVATTESRSEDSRA
jgi:MFS family permease